MIIDEEDSLRALRAIHRRFVTKKAAIQAQVAQRPAIAGWAAEEIKRAHQAAVREADQLLERTGIERHLDERLSNLRPNVIARRDGRPDVIDAAPGAIDRALAEVQLGRKTPADPMLPHLSVAALERRASTASLAELGDIRAILAGRAEGHADGAVRESAQRALHGLEQHTRALLVDSPNVRRRAELFPELKQIQEHIGLAVKAIREDCEDPGPAYESYAAVSAARRAGDLRPTRTLPDGRVAFVGEAQNES